MKPPWTKLIEADREAGIAWFPKHCNLAAVGSAPLIPYGKAESGTVVPFLSFRSPLHGSRTTFAPIIIESFLSQLRPRPMVCLSARSAAFCQRVPRASAGPPPASSSSSPPPVLLPK